MALRDTTISWAIKIYDIETDALNPKLCRTDSNVKMVQGYINYYNGGDCIWAVETQFQRVYLNCRHLGSN